MSESIQFRPRNFTSPVKNAGAPRGVTTELTVEGMDCGSCAQHVRSALEKVPGIVEVQPLVSDGRVRIQWLSQAQVNDTAAAQALTAAGYPAKAPAKTGTTDFKIEGMTCQNCVRHVTEAIQGVSGVNSVSVSLDNSSATVKWQSGAMTNPASVIAAVKAAGYTATAITVDAAKPKASKWSPFAGWKFNVVLGSLVTLPLMIGEWGFQLGMNHTYQWVAFLMALPVQIFAGARFYRGAWNQLKVGQSNMDTLVALGSTTAFTFSVWGLLTGFHGHLYFMESAAIITLVSVGHWLEAMMSERAASSLRALLNLAPATARRLTSDGREEAVAVAILQAGDRILLKPGDRVPTDGVVLVGQSAVDESMLTGESLPVEKAEDSRVYAGTVNQNGQLQLRVNATGEATALAQIIAVVQRAQTSRASIQKLGDKISSVFVPIVVMLAVLTGLWWGLAPESARATHAWLSQFLWPTHVIDSPLAGAFIYAAAVLIVACPCAMGLATPAAIMAGTNAAAKRGILIRDGMALEKSGNISAVLFDKTGTLTQGRLSVAATKDLRNATEASVIEIGALAAALARGSQHPLSLAVAQHVTPATVELSNWREVRGAGLEAVWQNQTLRLGSLNWMREQQIDLSNVQAFAEEWMRQGATVLVLANGHSAWGVFALRDEVKPAAAEVVKTLAAQGKSTWMITGDQRATAEAIAAQLGIPSVQVFAEVKPEQKAKIVEQLQARGERVAFVGDGINDAPALEQADLGIAVSRASDVAREAADIILLKSDVQAIPEALGLAQATLRTIKQNLFWAFFYNSAAIPLAMLGFLTPVLCAAAMGLSDVVVIGNALRLRRWRAGK